MKKISILFVAIMTIASYSLTAEVKISTEGDAADPSAMLEVKSTDKGFLPPRLTTAQRNAISSPVEGLTIYNTDKKCIEFYTGLGWRNLCAVIGPNDVLNPATGKIWMDRNLGATQVATSSTDADSYGDLYQWGRLADGHQIRIGTTTSTLSPTDVPGHGNFITNSISPWDWRNPQNDNLWQGVSGINNPCPIGYRLPTEAELNSERLTWSSQDAAGAFASPLKLPLAGYHFRSDGSLGDVGSFGYYWSSTVDSTVGGNFSRCLYFGSSYIYMGADGHASGFSVRCLKD